MNQGDQNNNQFNGDEMKKIKDDAQSLIGRIVGMVKNMKNLVPSGLLGMFSANKKNDQAEAIHVTEQNAKNDKIDHDIL